MKNSKYEALNTKRNPNNAGNSKYEILNSKRNPNVPNYKFQTVWGIEELEFRICLGFRY